MEKDTVIYNKKTKEILAIISPIDNTVVVTKGLEIQKINPDYPYIEKTSSGKLIVNFPKSNIIYLDDYR